MFHQFFFPLILLIYLLLRYLLDFKLNLSLTQNYLIESLFTLLVIYLFNPIKNIHFSPLKKNEIKSISLNFILFLFFGAFVALVGKSQGLFFPSDLQDSFLVLQLLVIAPFLEEAIYRIMFWNSLEKSYHKEGVTLILSAVLFSFSHLYAIFVISSYHSFIIYQSIYTLILGLLLGQIRRTKKRYIFLVLLHFSFNLGYWLTSILQS